MTMKEKTIAVKIKKELYDYVRSDSSKEQVSIASWLRRLIAKDMNDPKKNIFN